MNRLKTIVVEDERLPRLSLLAKLEEHRQLLDVVDDCDSYEAALESILRHRPDLLFLDIQLGGRDSISLLEELRHTIPLPYVIFTTAYSDREYLMSAIKLSAVDYLLKPVGK
ncbi:MAG: response regulator, partial [Bacteroidales bacterium]|nr:response regulator [Bacteroidales bacterium]